MKSRRVLAAVTALLAGVSALSLQAEAASKSQVILVCSGTAGCPPVPKGTTVYKTLGAGLSHAGNGDWVLVWPGKYKESLVLEPTAKLNNGLHIRGLNRSGVVLDGTGLSGSGIHVKGVNNTWIQNMSAEHYKAGSSNGFYWTGVDGFWGTHLTAYDNGDYGVYAYDSTSSGKTPSAFAYVYGSWNADSGIYVGGCRDCNTVVTNSRAYKNAIGYSGTNAGGELYLINSEWDHNAAGLVPNSLQSEPDLPQEGAYIVGNYIHDNNDKDVPSKTLTGIAPLGTGVDVAGGWSNIIRGNLIANHKHNGVLLHWLMTPPFNNQILYNTFVNNATSGSIGDADIAIDGTGIQNCAQGNVRRVGGKNSPATMDPPNPVGLSNCGAENPGRTNLGRGVYTPGNPVISVMTLLNAAGVTEPRAYTGPGRRPEAQLTMANPCAGVPANPWCRGGKPIVAPPSSPR